MTLLSFPVMVRYFASAATLTCLGSACLAPWAYGTPVSEPAYGSLRSSFITADLIAGATVVTDDPACSASAPWRGDGARSCRATIQLTRIYKGGASAGATVTINYQEPSQADLVLRHVGAGDYALFVLCQAGEEYEYCPGSLSRAFLSRPPASAGPVTEGGIQQLAADLVSGLQSADPDDVTRDADALWAVGDPVTPYLPAIIAAAQSASLPAQALLDALIIRADPTACPVDLSGIISLAPPLRGINSLRVARALENSGARCLSLVPALARSPINLFRVQAVTIAKKAHDVSTTPALISLLNDSDPLLAFYAGNTAEEITGAHFADKPRFEDFAKKPDVRNNYIGEWQSWAKVHGYRTTDN